MQVLQCAHAVQAVLILGAVICQVLAGKQRTMIISLICSIINRAAWSLDFERYF